MSVVCPVLSVKAGQISLPCQPIVCVCKRNLNMIYQREIVCATVYVGVRINRVLVVIKRSLNISNSVDYINVVLLCHVDHLHV